MAWQIDFGPRAERALKKLDRQVAARVVAYLEEMAAGDPRARGKALTGELGGFWRDPRRRLAGAVPDRRRAADRAGRRSRASPRDLPVDCRACA